MFIYLNIQGFMISMVSDKNRKKLGSNVIPIEYRLEVEPNFKTFKFNGKCQIKVRIKRATNKIALNSAELEIKSANVTSGKGVQEATIVTNAKDERLRLLLDRQITGNAELYIEFEGVNSDGMYGFYRSKYSHNGKEGHILTSQFEPADARKAFPCFDEPELKAVFNLSFVIDKDLDALSNMPIKETKSLGSKKMVTFHATPRMSTYLLYLAVGKFEYNTSRYKNKAFRVVTVPGKGKNTDMPMDFGKKFLKFYESYFGIDFPLPKMDLIAVPDFSAGAMENWGAITFREIELLGDPKTTSTAVKQRIAEVIAHELAHQWFGDLVTMRWWDDLWLNESFATFMATKAVDSVFPKWEFGLQDSIDTISTALAADQYVSTHPINVKVNEPSEINEIFDRISYDKGGSVLAMLEDYAGKETFRKGLHMYLKKHAYSNATKYDLWDAIEVIAKKADRKTRFSKVAKDWVDKTGYPIIEVSSTGENEARLVQRRYMLSGGSSNETWAIPVHYSIGGDDGFMLLDRKTARLDTSGKRYIKLNRMQKCPYRVSYPKAILDALGMQIMRNRMDYVDAWGIENDMFALARSSRIKVHDYLNFAEKYCFKGKYPLDQGVSDHLNALSVLLSSNKAFSERIRKLNIAYHRRLYSILGWNESESDRNVSIILRSKALASLGLNGYTPVINHAEEMFEQYAKTGKPLPKNIRGVVYSVSAWNGSRSTYNKLVRLYKKETDPENKRRLLVAASNFRDPGIIREALDFSLSKDVRPQDAFVPSAVISGNKVGKGSVISSDRVPMLGVKSVFSKTK